MFSVDNTVICHNLDSVPPEYVMKTLSLGPKNAVLDRFEQNDVLAELDDLLKHCKQNKVDSQVISDINIATMKYIKKVKKQKIPRHITMTQKYLKDNKLLAVPFDKGIGICIMKQETYEEKLSKILNLPQFEKYVPKRKDARNPVILEHLRIDKELKDLKKGGKIDLAMYNKLHTVGSQPARLYGLAKVHKDVIPVRPVLSMPGTAYHKIADQCTEWLSVVEECQIQSDTKTICDSLSSVELKEDEEIVSFDVSSLYTNVPVKEAIEHCANLLYSGKYELPPVDKETFIHLLQISTCNVLMLTHDGYYRQIDGLAMGSPPAPLLANGWLSKFDPIIKEDATFYFRYMDDIVRNIRRVRIDQKLNEINSLHENLKFNIEKELDGKLPFLDMLLM